MLSFSTGSIEPSIPAIKYISSVEYNLTRYPGGTSWSLPTYFGLEESSFWLIFFFICLIILLITLGLVLVFECCCCWCCNQRKFRELQVYDGGPLPSPNHLSTYEVIVIADECSPTFRKAAIKFDLLDINYRYLTSFVLPSTVFKFKIMSSIRELNQQEFALMRLAAKSIAIRFEPIPETNELWINSPPAQSIKFRLIRRNPLENCAHIRISHDCFLPMATISFKNITLVDDRTTIRYSADLTGRQIIAHHPCPPSGINLFQLESTAHQEN